MTTKKAILDWIPKDLGGRSKPPEGTGEPPYATVVHFPATGQPVPPVNGWTLVVRKVEVLESPFKWLVEVNYLFDDAPHHLLWENKEFELYEGKKCVARGRITD
jgi:hypothetical protein